MSDESTSFRAVFTSLAFGLNGQRLANIFGLTPYNYNAWILYRLRREVDPQCGRHQQARADALRHAAAVPAGRRGDDAHEPRRARTSLEPTPLLRAREP